MFLQTVCFSLFVSYVNSARCGISTVDPEADDSINLRIIGGTQAKTGIWPWLVALASPVVQENLTEVIPRFKCGGSLISHQHVLTAAHCYNEKLYLARLGVNDLFTSSKLDILIKEILVHERFDMNHAYHDIAIVLLQDKVDFTDAISPICLPRHDFFKNNSYENISAIVAGWGDTTYGQEKGSHFLQQVTLPVFNLNECKDIYKNYNTNITDNNICVGYRSGGKDACQGDSGGPLMAKGPSGKAYFVIGIVSHGLGCGLKGIPGVFTRVASYIPWIKASIANTTRRNAKRWLTVTPKPVQLRNELSDRLINFNPQTGRFKTRKKKTKKSKVNSLIARLKPFCLLFQILKLYLPCPCHWGV